MTSYSAMRNAAFDAALVGASRPPSYQDSIARTRAAYAAQATQRARAQQAFQPTRTIAPSQATMGTPQQNYLFNVGVALSGQLLALPEMVVRGMTPAQQSVVMSLYGQRRSGQPVPFVAPSPVPKGSIDPSYVALVTDAVSRQNPGKMPPGVLFDPSYTNLGGTP
jgi:hypothetical protein